MRCRKMVEYLQGIGIGTCSVKPHSIHDVRVSPAGVQPGGRFRGSAHGKRNHPTSWLVIIRVFSVIHKVMQCWHFVLLKIDNTLDIIIHPIKFN